MISALPDVLFYDNEVDEQNFEEQPKPIFKINVLQKFYNTSLNKYKPSYYILAFRAFFQTFQKEVEVLFKLCFLQLQQASEEPLYIVDDEEPITIIDDEEYEDEEDEEGKSLLKRFIKKIKQTYKNLKEKWDNLKEKWDKIKEYKEKWQEFKEKLENYKKKYNHKIKRFQAKVRKFYRKHVKPIIKKLKRMIRRFTTKLKRLFRIILRKLKKVTRPIIRFIKVVARKLIKKFMRKLGKMILKRAISMILKVIAGAFSATGIGAVIGAVIFAASIAWDVYDMTSEADTEMPEMEDESAKEPVTDISPPVKEPQEPPLPPERRKVKNISDYTIEEVRNYKRYITDKASLALYNSKEGSFQLIGRTYELYKLMYNWLLNEEASISRIISAIANEVTQYKRNLLDLAHKMSQLDIIKKLKSRIIKDQSKVKSRPRYATIESFDIINLSNIDMSISQYLRLWINLTFGKIKVNKGIPKTVSEDSTTNTITKAVQTSQKYQEKYANIISGSERIRRYILFEKIINKVDIDHDTFGVVSTFNKEEQIRKQVDITAPELFNFNIAIKPLRDLRKQKKEELKIKNQLLHKLYNGFTSVAINVAS